MAMPTGLWRPKKSTGVLAALTNGADIAVATIGANTYAVQLSATGANCMVRISPDGAAATATADILVKASDPPQVYACQPGDKIHAWGLAAGASLNSCEVTH